MIKSFGIFGYYGRKLRDWQRKYKEYSLDYNMFQIKTNILLTAVGTAVSMAAFGYCLFGLWTGKILYGEMTFFLQQRASLSNRFNNLVSTIPGMLNSAISAHRIRELMDLPSEKHDPDSYERMKTSADDGLAVLPAKDEGSGVARDGGGGEIGNVGEGDHLAVFQGVGKVAQAAAQDHAEGGLGVGAAADIVNGIADAGGKVHVGSP
jgi:ABC-type multidrug transport system fused ATPase/permease subunit